ncbi:MAG: hypothetical protein AB7W06_17315 [Alphaproteobacteria bacterium]
MRSDLPTPDPERPSDDPHIMRLLMRIVELKADLESCRERASLALDEAEAARLRAERAIAKCRTVSIN